MKTIFLTYYADSNFWNNTVLVPSIPNGVSYFRPFRYRTKWISPSVLDIIKHHNIDGFKVVLGMKFKSKNHQNVVIPIRKITITKIDMVGGQCSIYFRMGKLYDFRQDKELSEYGVTVQHNQDLLFFASNTKIELNTSEHEHMAWANLVDMIGNDNTFGIQKEARLSTYIRFCGIEDNVSLLREYKQHGSVFGLKIPNNSEYDITVLHRTPSLFGTGSVVNQLLSVITSDDNMTLDKDAILCDSNYGTHHITINTNNESTFDSLLTIQTLNNQISFRLPIFSVTLDNIYQHVKN